MLYLLKWKILFLNKKNNAVIFYIKLILKYILIFSN